MKPISFSELEYQRRKRITKREIFLKAMDEAILWNEWVEFIAPYYPEIGKRGRPPKAIETMLRMYLLQCWFNLSDQGLEDAVYDSYAFRSFMKINFFEEQVPDATTLLKFRHLLEKNGIAEKLFAGIARAFEEEGYLFRGGTIVDATIIQAPNSTKNIKRERDPEMKSTKKGNQYYFGMKVHIGVDAASGYIHSAEITGANIHDITVASKLIREDDQTVYGDSGYTGIQKRDEVKNDEHLSTIDYRINRRYKSIQKTPAWFNWEKVIEKGKSSVRCKVEHSFHLVKQFFGYTKARYKGIYKNAQRIYMLLASANIVMCLRAGRKLPA